MKQIRVMVVEDEAIIAMNIQKLLERLGYAVIAVIYTGEDAVLRVEELHPDLILMDIVLLGEMDGIEAAGIIREKFDIPIIYLTGNADTATIGRARETEPYGYILKPFTVHHIFSTIDTAMNRRELETKLSEKGAELERKNEELNAALEEMEATNEELNNTNEQLMRAHEALQESETRYKMVTELTSDYIFRLDVGEGGSVTMGFVTRNFYAVTGRDPGDAATPDLWPSIVHPDDLGRVMGSLQSILQSGKTVDIECRSYVQGGRMRWINIFARPVRDNDGKIKAIIGAVKDISERKLAEEARKEIEQKLKTVIEHSNELFYIHDSHNKLIYTSPQGEQILGFKPEELMMEWTRLATDNPINQKASEITERTIRTGEKSEPYELELFHKDGRRILMEIVESPVFDDEGKVVAISGAARDITARKRAEKALRESEELFRKVFEQKAIGMAMSDDQFRFIRANEAFCNMLGYREDELAGLTFKDITHPKHLGTDIENIARLIKGEIPVYQTEKRYITKSGSVIWGTLTLTVMRDTGGKYLYSFIMLEDITARKHAEEAVRDSEKRYNQIFDAAREGIWALDGNEKTTYVNPRMAEMLGYAADEMVGRNLFSFMDEESRDAMRRNLERRRQGISDRYEFEYLRKDGSTVRTSLQASPILDEDGNFQGAMAIVEDITERMRVEKALRESEERYRRITEAVTDYIFTVTISGGRPSGTVHGPASVSVTGYTSNEFAADPYLWINMVHPDDREPVRKQAESMLTNFTASSIEHRIMKKSGALRWVRNTLVPHIDTNGVLVSYDGLVQDITERKQMERILRKEKEMAQLYLDIIGTMIVAIDRDQKVTLVNTACCKILGLSREEIIGKNWFDNFIPETMRAEVKRGFGLLLSGDVVPLEFFENPVLTGRGELRTILWYNSLLYDENGSIIGTLSSGEDITDHKKAEEALRATEERYRSLYDRSFDAVYVHDLKGSFIDANDNALRLTGYSRDEILKLNFINLVSEEHVAKAAVIVKKILETGASDSLDEYHLRRKDGTLIWVETTGSLLYREGMPFAIQGIARDITDRKIVEKEQEIYIKLLSLINAPGTLRELIQDVVTLVREYTGCEAVGIRLRDGDDYPYYESRGFPEKFLLAENRLCTTDLNGQIMQDDIGHPLIECMCGNIISGRYDPSKEFFTPHGSFWSNSTTDLLATSTEADRQSRTRNRCNGEGYESVALIPLRTAEETFGLLQVNDRSRDRFSPVFIGFLERLCDNVAIALSKRKIQDELLKSEERYRRIFETASEGIWVLDDGFVTVDVNQKMADMLDYSVSEMIGKNMSYFVYQDDRADFEIKKEERRIGKHGFYERRFNKKDGSIIWILASASPLFDENGNFHGSFGMFTDITDRKKAEELITSSLHEKELLLKEIHHRVKNNFQIISSLIDIQGQSFDDEVFKEKFRDTRHRIRAMALVHEKLYHARDYTRIEFNDFIEEIGQELIEGYEDEKSPIGFELEADEVSLGIDHAIPCGLIVSELMTNSLKHAFPTSFRGKKLIKVTLRRKNGMVRLVIADNGIGLPEGIAIGETQTLGLSLVPMLAKQIGGELKAERKKGTKFIITFPEA